MWGLHSEQRGYRNTALTRYRKILAHVDTEDGLLDAYDQALRLAEDGGGAVTLIDVIEELPVFLRTATQGQPSLMETLKQEKRDELSKLATRGRERGVDVRVEVAYGKPFLEITRSVLREDYDLVLDTIHRGRFNLHGAVAAKLMRKCPCPVWAVQPDRGPSIQRVLAAVDPLSEHDTDDGLNRSIVDAALEVAALEQAEVHVVHAWGGRTVEKAVFGPYAPELGTYAREQVDRLLSHYSGDILPENVHVALGEADRVILKTAKDVNADLLVMGTVVRTGFQGVLMGNTAERVLSDVPCSVLALKPTGFVSPVEI